MHTAIRAAASCQFTRRSGQPSTSRLRGRSGARWGRFGRESRVVGRQADVGGHTGAVRHRRQRRSINHRRARHARAHRGACRRRAGVIARGLLGGRRRALFALRRRRRNRRFGLHPHRRHCRMLCPGRLRHHVVRRAAGADAAQSHLSERGNHEKAGEATQHEEIRSRPCDRAITQGSICSEAWLCSQESHALLSGLPRPTAGSVEPRASSCTIAAKLCDDGALYI